MKKMEMDGKLRKKRWMLRMNLRKNKLKKMKMKVGKHYLKMKPNELY